MVLTIQAKTVLIIKQHGQLSPCCRTALETMTELFMYYWDRHSCCCDSSFSDSSLREAGRLVTSSVAQLDPPVTSKLGNMVLGSPWGTIFLPWAKGQVLQRISTPPCNLAPRLPMLCCWIWISLCHAGTPMVSTQIPSEHSGKVWARGRWGQSQCIKVLQQCETWRL